MPVKVINQIRYAKAVLKNKKGINAPGVYFAVKDDADGYTSVEVQSLPTVELFIGQDTQLHNAITEWIIFNSQAAFGGIGADAFSRFPNLASITIWQESNDDFIEIDDNAFASNPDLDTIYVHPDKLAGYKQKYNGKTFASYFTAYELLTDFMIPIEFNGQVAPTTLTKAWLDTVTANMPLIKRNAKTTVIVPDYFTGIDSNAFSGLGSSFTYLNEIKCNGAKSFNAGFLNGASWCIHLWLDNGSSTFSGAYVNDGTTVLNANFRTIAPYLVFANYFMSEYPSEYPVVGYNRFVGGDDLPRTSPTGEYLWFSNIDFDADYDSPTGLENDDSFVDDYEASSSGYYYCYDKTEILVIQDDGTHVVTSAIVESAINGLDTPLEWITKLKVSNLITDTDQNAYADLSALPNLSEIELVIGSNLGGRINKYFGDVVPPSNIKTLNVRFTAWGNPSVGIGDTTLEAVNISCDEPDKVAPIQVGLIYSGNTGNNNYLKYISTKNVKYINAYSYTNGEFAFINAPILERVVFDEYYNVLKRGILSNCNSNGFRVYFGANSLIANGDLIPAQAIVYVKANLVVSYLSDSGWNNKTIVGYLDYTDSVPDYGTDYQATWYSDEDCTVQVLPANFVRGNRYYAKLLWVSATLTIEPQSGETTLTSAIITRELAKASSNPSVVTKIAVNGNFEISSVVKTLMSPEFDNAISQMNVTSYEYENDTFKLLDKVYYYNSNYLSSGFNITYSPNVNSIYDMKFSYEVDSQLTNFIGFFGYSKTTAMATGVGIGEYRDYTSLAFFNASGENASVSNISKGTAFNVKIDKTGVDINGNFTQLSSPQYFEDNKIRLLGYNYNNQSSGEAVIKCYFYKFRIIEGTTLMKAYLPFKNKTNNSFGLYDGFGQTFITDSNYKETEPQ